MPTPSPRNSSLSYAPYTPYQYSTSVIREENVPSNGSYNSPSLDFSMAATSPTKPSVSQSKNSAWRSGGYKDAVQSDKGTVTNYPEDEKTPRVLPPFTSFVRMQYQIPDPVVGDGGLSPHSTRQNHITLVSDLARYFHISPYDVLYNQSQSGYQRQNHGASSPQTKSRLGTTGTDPLMRFADVAMECSTVRGRRNLDEFAAAEVLTIPRGGSRVGPVSGKKSSFVQLEPLSRVRRTESISIDPALRTEVSSGPPDQPIYPTPLVGNNPSLPDGAPLFLPSPEPFDPLASTADRMADASSPETIPDGHAGQSCEFLTEEPKCSYTNGCTTGSPLRKVVSHIFGRNKLSTRQIPKNVWMYYCRKHYQRSRYRNPQGFAKQQVILVRRQCERLNRWGGVRHWTIKVRRREELRMNREGGRADEMEIPKNDTNANILDDENDRHCEGIEERDHRSSAAAERRGISAESSSNWILRFTGIQKSIEDIYVLLDRIETQVQQPNGGKFPDVELLPCVDLALARSIGLAKTIHPDAATDDDGGGEYSKERGSPMHRKRGRSNYRNSRPAAGSGGPASKKAKGTVYGNRAEGKIKESISFDSLSSKTVLATYSEALASSEPRSTSSCGMNIMSHPASPFTASHSSSDMSSRRSSLWEPDTNPRSAFPQTQNSAASEYVIGSPQLCLSGLLPSPRGYQFEFRPTSISPKSREYRVDLVPRGQYLNGSRNSFDFRKGSTPEEERGFGGPLEFLLREKKIDEALECIAINNNV